MTLDDSWWQLMTLDDSLLLNNVDFRFWSRMHPPTHGQTMLVLMSLLRLKRTDNLRYSFLLLLSNSKFIQPLQWHEDAMNKTNSDTGAGPLLLGSRAREEAELWQEKLWARLQFMRNIVRGWTSWPWAASVVHRMRGRVHGAVYPNMNHEQY